MPERQSSRTQDWLTQADAAAHLNVTTKSIRRYIASGELPAYRLGPRIIRVKRADLDALLRPIPSAGVGGGADVA